MKKKTDSNFGNGWLSIVEVIIAVTVSVLGLVYSVVYSNERGLPR
jgi:hypothetical protein